MKLAGITGADHLQLNATHLLHRLKRVQEEGPAACNGSASAYIMQGRGVFEGPTKIRADGNLYHARAVVIATGSRPFIPEYLSSYRERLLTPETLLANADFPRRIGILGLGPLGLELAYALSLLDVRVYGFDETSALGGLNDPVMVERARARFQEQFPIMLGERPGFRETSAGLKVRWGNDESTLVDAIFLALGRRPHVEGLGLKRIGVEANEEGELPYDEETYQLEGLPIYLANHDPGDQSDFHRARLHGFHAARSALGIQPSVSARANARLQLSQTDPALLSIGEVGAAPGKKPAIVGDAVFEMFGGFHPATRQQGFVRVFVEEASAIVRGIEIMAHGGEHAASFLASLIQREIRAQDLLDIPAYPPLLEEGLRLALSDALIKLEKARRQPAKAASS